MDIKQALTKLDAGNDEHWTADGAPRVDAVAELTGDGNIKRSDITNAAPDFIRPKENPNAEPFAEGATPADEGQGETQPEAQADGKEEALGTEAVTEPVTEPAPTAAAPVEPRIPEIPDPVAEPAVALPEDAIPTARPELVPAIATPTELETIQAGLPGLRAELEEKSKAMYQAQGEAERSKSTADTLADQVNALNRRITAVEQTDPDHNTAGVRAYIAQQNVNRMARAMRLQKFIGDSGVNPQELARELDVRSPIDRAMAGRKAPRGSQRPVLPSRQ